ncbi:MAG: DUF4142 domain-containing protein [Verrucomicrobium sp.]|nr:DUF4142 domain-containing protein [Verrucomicrobium sp.]
MIKLNHLHIAVLSASLLFGGAASALADSTPLSSTDKAFLKSAVQGGLFEIKTGDYAAENAKYDDVQDLGKTLASDHASLNKKLISFAEDHGYSVPADASAVTKTKVGALTVLSGGAFDAAYLKALKSAHKTDIKAFKEEAANGNNSDLRSLAKDALPTLKHHYKEVRTVEEKLDSKD